jgi:tetratricopeptide (TPR) repeat protein
LPHGGGGARYIVSLDGTRAGRRTNAGEQMIDLTTLTVAVLLALTALGMDTVWHPIQVVLETSSAGGIEKVSIDDNMIGGIVRSEVDRISSTPTLMGKPRVELGNQGGIGMAIASAANLQSLAIALQRKAGVEPDQIRIALFSENGTTKVLVTGTGRQRLRGFEQTVEQHKGETVIELLHRAAVVGMSRIDPYLTALNLMQRHAGDKDFTDPETLISFAKSQIPPTPASPERSLFENLQGILALFRGNRDDAHTWFQIAVQSNPDNVAATLNLALADLELDRYEAAARRMERLLRDPPTFDGILVSTAYVTWGAALLGMHDVNGADHALAKAIETNPSSSIAWDLWSQVKAQKGDPAQAERLHQQALAVSGNFENYGEIAALYFRLSWQGGEPVTLSQFSNPTTMSLH